MISICSRVTGGGAHWISAATASAVAPGHGRCSQTAKHPSIGKAGRAASAAALAVSQLQLLAPHGILVVTNSSARSTFSDNTTTKHCGTVERMPAALIAHHDHGWNRRKKRGEVRRGVEIEEK